MSIRTTLPAAILVLGLAAVGCTTGSAPRPTTAAVGSSDPATSPPSASPVVDGIAHPTGPDDVVLRFDESGGFVAPEFLAAHVPQFTLYGDGTVVFVSSAPVPPSTDGVALGQPVLTATLTEAQVQSLLEYAIRDGRLGTARAEYQNPLVADAPTAVFTLNADGAAKTVSVVALGMDDQQATADTAIKKAMNELGKRLRDFDTGTTVVSTPYAPTAYRGTLTEQQGLQGVTIRDWPWTDLMPADFTMPSDPTALQQGTATLTPEQAAALKVNGLEAGITGGVYLRDAGGTVYSFVLRPLLPDEAK